MFETAQKYSDHQYCRKEEVAQDFQYIMIDPIWQEIESYRKLFKWSVPFANEYYITRSFLVNDRINDISESLYAISYDHKDEHLVWNSDTRILDDIQQATMVRFVHQMQINPLGDPEQTLLRFLDQCQLNAKLTKVQCAFFLDNQISLIMKLFISMEFFDKVTSYALSIFLLGSRKMLYPLTILPLSELFDTNIFEPTEFDLTYKLLRFLDNFRLNLSKQVVSLSRNARDDVRILSKQELLERYPLLNEHQVSFYLSHNQIDHYYTIKDYMNSCHVCYETARYSLDMIVEQNWYQKQRIGKKFMYSVV